MVKLSFTGIVALVSVILYAIILTSLEILVVYFHHTFVDQFNLDRRGDGISEADLIYHAIFILSLAFQVLLCVDALWRKNSMQLIALVLYNILSLVYAGVQLYQHMILEDVGTENATFIPQDPSKFPTAEFTRQFFIKRMRPLEYVIIGIVTAFSGYLAALSFKLTREFGWEVYRTYSADVKVRDAFRSLSILQTLIKLDIFFIGAYAIQLIPSQSIGYSNSIAETIIIFFVGTIMLLMAWYSIMQESKYILLCVINLLALSLIYMVYRLISINISQHTDGGYDPYEFTRRLLSFFLATTICLVLATIFYAVKCFKNMMQGLYIFAAYGLPGQDQNVPEINQNNHNQNRQNSFNSEYLGYNGYNGYNGYTENNNLAPSDSQKKSKRASKIAEVQSARLSRRISID
ncbi:hypothetical protein RclHR1_02360003 [Rhizophagus clarus]|uniref:TRP C-terminal domain-containing protein n=1 Tax=Rhizophagus clarus TaxID=94130 RepID=A0A2Z6QY01_9GLOM|nr:hypothetical protein RclHR1_02360003 [Rhizophagus clarus]GET03881.1 hypothetical protein GLOIN_2v1753948 [Rhizophagus clarus]